MSTAFIGALILVVTVVLIFLGVHIGVALLTMGLVGVWILTGDFSIAGSMLGTGTFYAVFNYSFAVIPLFILMGLFANASGASTDLYKSGFAWFGRLPGGLGIVTVVANAVFAAVTGVSVASAAVFGKIAVPEMLKYGYSKRFSVGCVCGSSALGMLVPPSLMLIVYGLLSGESIGKLFIAGIIPGIVLSVLYSLFIGFRAHFFPKSLGDPIKPEAMSWADRFRALGKAGSVFCLVVAVLGGIYGGVFTPTEAGAVGCVVSLLILILKGRFTMGTLKHTLMDTGFTSSSVFLLIIGAQIFSRMLSMSGLVDSLSTFAVSLDVNRYVVFIFIVLILMLLGTFLDVVSILIISMPILLPIVQELGFNLLWFGIVATISIETGLITPPFGMSVFVVKGAVGDLLEIEDIFIGSFPFLLIILLTVLVLTVFPDLVTWLPNLM